uniref:Phosphotransferase n=1 Tax=Cynoglossus semilaevis TaxID=244447 RepID=A0A3P8WZI3_CYNSE
LSPSLSLSLPVSPSSPSCLTTSLHVSVQPVLQPLRLSLDKLRDVSSRLHKGLVQGLGKHSHHRAAVKMLPTFVRATPDGTEKGDFLWGGFGDDGSLRDIQTEFDQMVDKTSINPGVHIFEKMISGMYLGEIVRLLLLRLSEEKLLFKGQKSEVLQTPEIFQTKFISEIEEEDTGLDNARRILTQLDLQWDEADVRVVRLVCDTVSSRSARLCAAALATIANKMRLNRGLDRLQTTVGVDGTVYRKHPNFSEELQLTVRLLAPECSITFLVSEDGSGKGAAMVTAVAQRLALQSRLLDDSEEDEEEEEEDEETS